MTKKLSDPPDAAWVERFMSGTMPVAAGVPAFQPQPSPVERKADERTRLVREMTDAATETRVTTSARLKAMRLAKETEDRAQSALKPSKTGKPKTKS